MQKLLIILSVWLIFNVDLVLAEKYRGEVFRIINDPASTAMGFTGVSYPVSLPSTIMNPASLSFAQDGAYFSHFELYGGFISLENLCFKYNTERSDVTSGFYLTFLHSDPLEITQLRDANLGIVEGNIEVTGKDAYKFYLFTFAFGREVNEFSNFGLNLKLFRENFSNYQENGAGLDIGYIITFKDLNLGVTVRDAIFSFFTGNSSETSSPSINFGITKINRELIWNVETDIFTDGHYPGSLLNVSNFSFDLKAGVEYRPTESLGLRLGFYRGYFNAGAGLKIKRFNIDYSISPNPELYTTHKIGAGLCF